MMKLTTLLMILGCLQLNAAVFSQTINLTERNVPLSTVFSKMEKQSGYTFFSKFELIRDMPKVNVDFKQVPLKDALDELLGKFSLSYTIIGKTVVIKEAAAITINFHKKAPLLILGVVQDEKKQPLSGANITVKGTNLHVSTDNEGKFRLLVLNPETTTLQFSYIGYRTHEVKVTDLKSPVVIRLSVIASDLDQIQVTAYGATSKRLNTGDQTTVTAQQIENHPVSNILSVLQGMVPGMTVSQTTGMPGGTFKVNIRGRNGINTGSDPLYVIDGVPYTGGSYRIQKTGLSNNAYDGYDALSFINPLDIESVNVLKDADATSIYGSRGANGVILITTKKGKAGATKVDINVSTGISKVTRIPKFLNTQQYLQMRKEAKLNDKMPLLPSDYDINGTWDTTRYTNWAKELLNGVGHLTNAQASVSGGNENTQYLLSGNFRKQDNIQKYIGGADQTASLHFNILNSSADKKFNVAFTGGYTYNLNTIPSTDLTSAVGALPPNAPDLFKPDGTLNFENNTFYNPIAPRNTINSTTATNLMSSLVLSYKLARGLELKANLGYNKQQLNEFLGTPTTAYSPMSNVTTGSSNFTTDNRTSWSIEPQLNYNRKISNGDLSATIGSSLQKQIQESTILQAMGYSSDLLLKSITAGTSIIAIPGVPYNYENYKFNALFGRLNYNWKEKYLLNLSGRYDGSSKFGADRQFHFFGSAGAAWIFTEEKAIRSLLPFLNFGKLRASYGVTGNDQIGNNIYLETYSSTAYPYQGIPGLSPNRLPNASLSWETTRKAEVALELQFLKGRIALEANYYSNKTYDILSSSPLATITGFSSVTKNMDAIVKNKGLELTLTTKNIDNDSFSWTTTLMLTRQRNKLISFPGITPAELNLLQQPVGTLRVFRFAGVNAQTGVYQFYDKNGNITNTPVQGIDDTGLINLTPDYFGSVQNGFRYKGFTLDFLIRFIKQVGVNSFGQSPVIPPGLAASNATLDVLARWQKPNDVTNVQRYSSSFLLYTPYSNAKRSDFAYGDAAYIRFQNLSFGYRLDPELLKRFHIKGLRIYVQGENLLTISKYGNYDPENQSSYRMPPLKIFTTGLQLTL